MFGVSLEPLNLFHEGFGKVPLRENGDAIASNSLNVEVTK
jgi:hypothetical protein